MCNSTSGDSPGNRLIAVNIVVLDTGFVVKTDFSNERDEQHACMTPDIAARQALELLEKHLKQA